MAKVLNLESFGIELTDSDISEITNEINNICSMSISNKINENMIPIFDQLKSLYQRLLQVQRKGLLLSKKAKENNEIISKYLNKEGKLTVSLNTAILKYQQQKTKNTIGEEMKVILTEAYETINIIRKYVTGEEITYLIGVTGPSNELYTKEVSFADLRDFIIIEAAAGDAIGKLKISSNIINNQIKNNLQEYKVNEQKQSLWNKIFKSQIINAPSGKKFNYTGGRGLVFESTVHNYGRKKQNYGFHSKGQSWVEGPDLTTDTWIENKRKFYQLKFFGGFGSSFDQLQNVGLTSFTTCINAVRTLLDILSNSIKGNQENEIKELFGTKTLDKNFSIKQGVKEEIEKNYEKLIGELTNLTNGK